MAATGWASGEPRLSGSTGCEPSADPAVTLQYVYPRLSAIARSLVRQADVEDLVQESLVEVLARHPGFAGIEYPTAYAKRVLLRRVARMRTRWRDVPAGLMQGLDSPDESGVGEDAILGSLAVTDLLGELPPRQRACVYLHVVAGLKDDQVAEVLNCRPSTVRSQIARALGRLRALHPSLAQELEV
jgi:RNA polymerase sigma factor (sigma-70 family)